MISCDLQCLKYSHFEFLVLCSNCDRYKVTTFMYGISFFLDGVEVSLLLFKSDSLSVCLLSKAHFVTTAGAVSSY